MLRTTIVAILLLAATSVVRGQDPDSGCIYDANKAATVEIEYSYTVKDGDSTESGSEKGSGFIISPDGRVLTANHVISPSAEKDVATSESVTIHREGLLTAPLTAKILARDSANDLALLQLPDRPNNEPWPTVSVGEPVDLPVGAYLIAMGFPGTSDLTLTLPGQRSAHNAMIDTQLMPWWQTSLVLNSGNSGGPVFGSLGTVVGVAVAKSINSQQVTWIIPISRTVHFLDAANVKPVKYGSCAVLPVCRTPSNGVERYVVDETLEKWSDWRGGGYNQTAWCGDFINSLRQAFPNSTFFVLRSDEGSRDVGFRQFQYHYYCQVRRVEGPVYKQLASEACSP